MASETLRQTEARCSLLAVAPIAHVPADCRKDLTINGAIADVCKSESTSSFIYGFARGAIGTWNICTSFAKQLVPKLMNRLRS